MYFRRIRKLDIPVDLRTRIVDEIDNRAIVPTGMNQLKNKPPWEETFKFFKSLPDNRKMSDEHIEYIKSIYETVNLVGFELSKELTADVYKHYDSFLSMVPDEPKITIKFVSSTTGKFTLHTGADVTASLTCVIKGHGPETIWYEPKPEFLEKHRSPKGTRHRNFKGLVGYYPEVEKVTSIKLNPWEMIFFDHNSLHGVEDLPAGFERILFSIGFLNITETELEDIYDEWWIKNKKD